MSAAPAPEAPTRGVYTTIKVAAPIYARIKAVRAALLARGASALPEHLRGRLRAGQGRRGVHLAVILDLALTALCEAMGLDVDHLDDSEPEE